MGSYPSRHAFPRVAAALTCSVLVALLSMPGIARAADVIGGPQLGEPGIVVSAGAPALPPISATSFVVADGDTGEVLAAQNAHQKLAPASTLKTLTALTVLQLLPPNLPTVAHSDAPSVDGTKAGIVAGTTYSVDNLYTAMLMMSANDAAVALADANGGLVGTLAQMNTLAAQLQADDTVALTPDGLDAKGQTSSAYDLALIFRAGLAVPSFLHYLSLRTAQFPAPKGQSFQIQTHDRLLTDYSGMIGGKNGYTVAALASYVGAATRGGHTIIVAVMRDQANFWPEVKTLLDWGFAADGKAAPVGQLVDPVEATPQPLPSATEAALPQPAVLAVPPAPVAKAAPVAAHSSDAGVGISAILIWSAIGVGALFFFAAVSQFANHRRRERTDERYLTGLSRLASVSDKVSELT
jgi:serine-type D-Ala-D-Ala carboxypeptidase (penicillin-binding protein 5/6)